MTPPGPRSSALSRTQPQSIQGIYWDLSKQRISKLYRFFISNNPSPRIRTFKSQSNLTSDRWPGSISHLSPHPSCPGLWVSPWCHLDPSVILTPASCQGQSPGVRMTLASIVSMMWPCHDQWPRYQDTLATSQHLESSSVQIILD